MATERIAIRQDTASNWETANPTLASGEQGHESDTGKRKIGDGSTAWNSLDYMYGTAATADTTTSATDTTEGRVPTLEHYPSDSAWTEVTSLENGWTGTVRYIKRLGWVTVTLSNLDGSSSTGSTVLTLPSAYETSQNVQSIAYDRSTDPSKVGPFNALSDGRIGVADIEGTSIRGQLTYPVI